MLRYHRVMVVLAAMAALVTNGVVDAASVKPPHRSDLQSLCTHEVLQAIAPPGVTIKDIRDLDPAVASVRRTKDGVAYISEGLFGDGAPAYCVVTGSVVTNATTGKTANFGAALPAPQAWSRRVLMQGCGGTCGDVFSDGPPAATLIRRGYAVWTTDDGHADPAFAYLGQPVGVGTSWMIRRDGEPNTDALVDYAYRAVHIVANTGKAFTTRVYDDRRINRAYFQGCSDGGREAMQEAMLYPEDFDGIIAGAPFLDPAGTVIGGMATQLAQFKSPEAVVPAEAFDVVSKAILAKCDAADGTRDGLVQNPAACSFDPQRDIPKCQKGSYSNSSCLTGPQIDAVTAMLNAVRDSAGSVAALGYATVSTGRPGGGWGLASWVPFPEKPRNTVGPFPFGPHPERDGIFSAWTFTDGMLRDLTFAGDAEYNSLKTLGMRFRQLGQPGDGAYAAVLPAETAERIHLSLQNVSFDNPYLLASFIAQGRKLLIWHGFADGLLTAYATIRFYRELAALHGGYKRLQKDVELFMAPDVAHCGWGGAGPDAFQTLYHDVPGEMPPPEIDARHDLLMALERWVNTGSPPRKIIASRYQGDDPHKPVVRTMPLCPFPAMAHYDGRGALNRASSWRCPQGDRSLLKIGRFGSLAGADSNVF